MVFRRSDSALLIGPSSWSAAAPRENDSPQWRLLQFDLGLTMIGLRPAASSRSRSPQRFPVNGRAHGCTEVTMAVEPRRRHQSGETIEQLQRRQAQRTCPARAGLGAIVPRCRRRSRRIPIPPSPARHRSAASCGARARPDARPAATMAPMTSASSSRPCASGPTAFPMADPRSELRC